ncbi:MAG: hypothetical protein L6R28_09955 [Planctomycetes bacterium]|nr:hypothetical protein [Planctomycetota bacterium]
MAKQPYDSWRLHAEPPAPAKAVAPRYKSFAVLILFVICIAWLAAIVLLLAHFAR